MAEFFSYDPDRHKNKKSDPDRHQNVADQQHCRHQYAGDLMDPYDPFSPLFRSGYRSFEDIDLNPATINIYSTTIAVIGTRRIILIIKEQ